MSNLRDQIIAEIRRLAEQHKGRPPGVQLFENETGITEAKWRGKFWARWGDALQDAGYSPNELTARRDDAWVLESVAKACRHFGRLPTGAELKLYRRLVDSEAPSLGAIHRRYPRQSDLILALRNWLAEKQGFEDVIDSLPTREIKTKSQRPNESTFTSKGYVYLIQSGNHYKIGRSDNIEKRIKEIRVALPETTKLVHAINTDDPSGIEAYWHRRFADRRANGEWFKLELSDVIAFKRRKFQ